ncbi:MAG: hypothetical protein L7V87_06150 [Verrucomicrobiales bacterium]|jgi:hypothetical protein|nr:hypothetical protein [Verrucomicrobiales bacterium]
MMTRSISFCLFLATGFLCMGTKFLPAQDIPDELLEDEHVREEFGVNKFTTPSIRKIFQDLETLRPLPYDELKRPMPEGTPQDRTELALTVGLLLADGFFAVESEQLFDLEPVGRSLLQHAKVLGSGTRISSHMKSLLEKGALNDWDALKIELARTQKDVEKEMVLIRDVDAANLISLGGWLRAFEIGCAASLNPYNPEKASILARPNVVEYFVLNLETLEPQIQKNEKVQRIRKDLGVIQEKIDLPKQEILSEEEIQELRAMVEELVDLTYGSERLIVSASGESKPTNTGDKPTTVKPAATGGVISGEVPQ